MARSHQAPLPISHVRNRGLFSNHWFERRLELEPEWTELRDQARSALSALAELWERERDRVERYGTEASLEHAFIQPVFEILGWPLIYQRFLQGRKPDYALFLDEDAKDLALQVERNSEDFWRYPTIVADAKAWAVPLNRPSITTSGREFPPQQIEWYCDRSRLDYGILTNGGVWRLVPRVYGPQQRRFQTYLECDLAGLLEEWRTTRNITQRDSLTNEFLEFFLFFSPAGHQKDVERQSLISRAIEGSSAYRVGVGEGLKERAFDALRLCIEGFLNLPENALLHETDLQTCRQQSFILLYRLLFIMYAEDRRLLPYGVDSTYTDNRSLGRHRDEVAGRMDRVRDGTADDFSTETTDTWQDLQSLFDLVDVGGRRYRVPPFNGGLFHSGSHPFLVDKRISDYYLARIIDHLGRAKDPVNPEAGLFRVDYRDLAIQHLGAVYEGLLELVPERAARDMVVISRRVQGKLEEKYHPETDPLPAGWQLSDRRYRKGSIYLKTKKGERRASGSYYTPDQIVNHLVENTLVPLCESVSSELQSEIVETESAHQLARGEERDLLAARLKELRADFDNRILKLKVLDPAMGSGHFLIRACQRLAEEIATNANTGDPEPSSLGPQESTVAYWKRRVVENCLYGVDLNEMAVELAKLALWLETVASDEPLSFLDHHLHHGNSLVGAELTGLATLPGEIALLADSFAGQWKSRLPALLDPLARIARLPSDTPERLQEKERYYNEFEKAREPFRRVGDLWCAAFSLDEGIDPEKYQAALDAVERPRRFDQLAREEWFQSTVAAAEHEFGRCFHWEIEFPEAFFDGDKRRDNPGFDAVIGNPPYDVLSELETERVLTAFKAFILANPTYDASRRGKNNLYKLFVCRALQLLRNGGYLGFITPMAILGDDQAADLRRKIVSVGRFTGIEAFPQKDDPKRRVFPEAKLSTAAFTICKRTAVAGMADGFVSRIHPADQIDEESPSLRLSTAAIPLYDPENFTIVSCSQNDWNLATRIMGSGRLKRLGDFGESFQGEINETNERKNDRISYESSDGPEVIRGAHICLYASREASQGTPVFVVVDRFLARGNDSGDQKAFHHRHERIGLQRKSPQNNFRRLIAAPISTGTFLLESVSYIPAHKCRIPLPLVLGVLNTKVSDWYFRMGSTNAQVNEYQICNLPCPEFAASCPDDIRRHNDLSRKISEADLDTVFDQLHPLLYAAPFPEVVSSVIIDCVKRICAIEHERGEITRTARSALDPAAQPYQDLIDRLFFAMAGLTPEESAGLERRLAEML